MPKFLVKEKARYSPYGGFILRRCREGLEEPLSENCLKTKSTFKLTNQKQLSLVCTLVVTIEMTSKCQICAPDTETKTNCATITSFLCQLNKRLHKTHPTLKMTTAQVVETSVAVNNNSPTQDYVQPHDQTHPTFEMIPGFKPFTIDSMLPCVCSVIDHR